VDGEQAYVVAGMWDEFGEQLVAQVVDGRAA
jgi:hypothetical protein